MNINLGFVADASGTDTITATWSPAPASLYNNLLLFFVAAAANTSTTPTLNANGLGAKTIVKKGGSALSVGDIPGANAVMAVCYDATNTRWELLNPATGSGTIDGSGTTNQLPYWVDSDTLGALSTATYPSLTELSYVKGVTSAIQTQLDAKTDTVVITLDGGTSNPADAQTYYCGIGRTTVTPTASHSNFSLGFAGTLIGAIVSAGNNSVTGSTEDSTLKLRNETTATSTTIGTFKTNGSSNAVVNTTFSGLSIAIGASDLIAGQWDTPTWATNPTNVLFTVTLIIRKS